MPSRRCAPSGSRRPCPGAGSTPTCAVDPRAVTRRAGAVSRADGRARPGRQVRGDDGGQEDPAGDDERGGGRGCWEPAGLRCTGRGGRGRSGWWRGPGPPTPRARRDPRRRRPRPRAGPAAPARARRRWRPGSPATCSYTEGTLTPSCSARAARSRASSPVASAMSPARATTTSAVSPARGTTGSRRRRARGGRGPRGRRSAPAGRGGVTRALHQQHPGGAPSRSAVIRASAVGPGGRGPRCP